MAVNRSPSAFLRILLIISTMIIASCARTPGDLFEDFSPSISSQDTDFTTVAQFADYAAAAYRSEEEIRALFPDTVRVGTPQGTKATYFLEVLPQYKLQTISVRGTHSFNDMLHDIEFRIVQDNLANASFHKGFQADALLIYADVKPFLNKSYRTRLTGHSLGAAVSAILMIYMQRDGYIIEPSVNFGQPKFTNAAGARLYEDLPLQRVVDANDVVPMLPPTFAKHPKYGIYTHLGEEIILLDGPDYVRLNTHDAERISVDEYWRERSFASKEDHRMTQYVSRIDVPSRMITLTLAVGPFLLQDGF